MIIANTFKKSDSAKKLADKLKFSGTNYFSYTYFFRTIERMRGRKIYVIDPCNKQYKQSSNTKIFQVSEISIARHFIIILRTQDEYPLTAANEMHI